MTDLRSRETWVDAAGLLALLGLLIDCLAPRLLVLDTLTAGGDTPGHYLTAAFLGEYLLPRGRLHGWYAAAYLGHPLLLYYFPLPFLLMAAVAPLVGLPVAFKLVMAAGVLLVPLAAYGALRLMGFRFPAPLVGAAAVLVFLFVDENPIWGGTFASTLAGEFSYTWGTALALLFLGAAYRAYARGHGPAVPASLLALTALAHGYAVLWAGCASVFFLYGSRRPGRTFVWLLSLALLAFALAAFFLVPLLTDWDWTTAYDDPWITVAWRNLFPPRLAPLFVLAVGGLGLAVFEGRHTGGIDQRLLFLLHAALAAAVLAVAAPAFGVIDVRLVPFAQLAVGLFGAAALGRLLAGTRAPRTLGLAVTLLAAAYAHAGSALVRAWAEWDFSGVEKKELWPAFRELSDALAGGVNDPRVAVEHHADFDRGGTRRLHELLPHYSGRSILEGLYNQAGLHSHAVYYLVSELSPEAPNPFRTREYSRFDPDTAVARLPLFNVREVVARSAELRAALAAHGGVEAVREVAPFAVFRLRDAGAGYAEALRFAPVRSSPEGWRDKAYRWLTRKPPARALLVFSDDGRFDVVERDAWLPPAEVPLPGAGGVQVEARLEPEALTLRTNRPGHPVLVKVSYHPRWRAHGADGPYLVSPALMLVIPRQETVRLEYAARTWADHAGLALTLVGLGFVVAAAVRAWRRRARGGRIDRTRLKPFRPTRVDCDGLPVPPRRWGAAVPLVLALLLVGARFVPRGPSRAAEASELSARAQAAFAAAHYADAAEYARHALARASADAAREALETLREESLRRAAALKENRVPPGAGAAPPP